MLSIKRFFTLLAASLEALGTSEITPSIAAAETPEVRIAKQNGRSEVKVRWSFSNVRGKKRS